MRRLCALCLLFVLTGVLPVMANGTVEDVTFFSPTLGYNQHMNVYLPEGYDGVARYPVIFFLHGIGSTYNDYGFTTTILDAMIGGGLMEPVIFVIPNGMCPPYGGSMWTNSEMYGAYEDYVAHDVVSYVDAHYATLPYRETRAIMGHSMGGFGALTVAFKHADSFSDVVSLSGLVDLEPISLTVWSYILCMENGGTPPYSWNPLAGFFTGGVFTGAGAFTPNFTNPPYYVDFPLDANANWVMPVLDHWQTHMPPYTLRQYVGSLDGLRILLDCGTLDELSYYSQNLAFCDSLDALGVPYQFTSFVGGHTDHLPERFQMAFLHLEQVLCPTECAGYYSTLTEGQWGQDVCHGNNFACFRDQYFDEVYPSGMVVGNGYSLTFTSSAAVAAALPAGGNPGMLTMSLTNPTARDLQRNGGTFAGHVITLKLNADYANAAGFRYLDQLMVGMGYGAFTDMALYDVLDIAESVLGGDLTALPAGETLASLHDLINVVNRNFVGGNASNRDLLLQLSFGPCMPCDEPPVGTFSSVETTPLVEVNGFALGTNYPNPFNATTTISYFLPSASEIRVDICNILGQRVETLFNGRQESGAHSLRWDATDVASGIYFARLSNGTQVSSVKMLLLK